MDNQSKERIQYIFDLFNAIGKTDHGMERLAYTKEELQVQETFKEECLKLGMTVHRDEAGNMIGRRQGTNEHAPAIAIGSHLDTVYSGGEYDGTAGIVSGLEVIHRLNRQNIMTSNPVEVIAFSGEESSRFGVSTIGSKAMAGEVKKDCLESLNDKDQISFEEALEGVGLNIKTIENAARDKRELKAYLELHIEQGPELEIGKNPIGIATGIAAPTRLNITIEGKASHSGTTSMDKRKDALVCASYLVTDIEESAIEESKYRTVATVGVLDVYPRAMNVVPGKVNMKVDIRGIDMDSKNRVITKIQEKCRDVMASKGVYITVEKSSEEEPVLLDSKVQNILELSCQELGIEPFLLPSGAGHDAMNMAKICPSGLIFVPSRDGLSHHPDEHTEIADIIKGIDVLERAVRKLALERAEEEVTDEESKVNGYIKSPS